MSQPKPSIHLYIKLFIAFIWLSLSISSQSQSLIGNENIKNFKANLSNNIVLKVGAGLCETSITNIKVSENGLLLSMNKPSFCKFKNLDLINGTDIFTLSGLSEEFELDGENYTWRDDAQKGGVFFSKTNSQIVKNLQELKIREPNCKASICLNSANLPNESNEPRAICTNNGDGTFTGKDGTIWQLCPYGQTYAVGRCEGTPKKVNWYEAMNAAKDSKFVGKNDWILPTTAFLNGSIHPTECKHPSIRMYVDGNRNPSTKLIVDDYFWTALTIGGKVHITNSSFIGGYNYVYYDTNKSAQEINTSYDDVKAIFVRNAPSADERNFSIALPFVKCDSRCLADRKNEQAKSDAESDGRAIEKWSGLRGKFAGDVNSNASTVKKFEIYKDKGQAASWAWFKKEIVVSCLQGREKGGLPSVYLLPSGRWKTTYKGEHGTMTDAANAACD
jgi:hypothetical protein